MLKAITESPYLNLFSGLILLGCAGYEIWHSVGEFTLGAHHGIAIFGIIQTVKSIPEALHGLKLVREGEEDFAH